MYLHYSISCSGVELKLENYSIATISVLKLFQITAILLINKFKKIRRKLICRNYDVISVNDIKW